VGSTMRPVTPRRPAVALATLLLAAAGCGGDGTTAGPSAGRSPERSPAVAAGNAAEAALLPTDAVALPEFDLARYEELLGQLEGTPVVVNFWGSWCGPCRDEAPDLAAAHAAYGDRVQFLGVDLLDARASARDFMAEFGWTYPSVFDPPAAIRDGLGLLGQPVTLFYDAAGELVDRWPGPIPRAELRTRLARLVAR
jgi:cytochrome c biogenesis protein CcmG/thiol:disulfide interchange protein DsbE